MNKGAKKAKIWLVLLQGSALALGINLLGVSLLAFVVVRGNVSNAAVFPILAMLCLVSSLAGGMITARRLPWGTLPSALLGTICYISTLVLMGISFCERLTLDGRGGILLLCAVIGGTVAGLISSRRKVRRKRG